MNNNGIDAHEKEFSIAVFETDGYINEAELKRKISHYTSANPYDSEKCILSKILSGKLLKFNRIDKLNDKLEGLNIEGRFYQFFVSSFIDGHDESIAMWYVYGKKNQGIQLRFTLNDKLSNRIEGICKYAPAYFIFEESKEIIKRTHGNPHIIPYCTKIEYIRDLREINFGALPANNLLDYRKAVRSKHKAWSYENELRLAVILGANNGDNMQIFVPPISVFLPLNFDNFNLEVILNPWATEDFENYVKKICSKNDEFIKVKRSVVHNKVIPIER